jgi:parallel beta-helix repeat protein
MKQNCMFAKRALLTFALVALGWSFAASSHAASYYVDNAVSASGNGRSWSSAWKSFSNINWGIIKPGDTIYISGGTVSKTYNETFTVNADGTAASPIVITKGIDLGHNGTVILDGRLSLAFGVLIEYDDYVTVRGLTVENYKGSGQIRVRYSTGDVIENNDIYVTGHGGVFLWSNTGVVVRNNKITTPTNSTAQTDGIYSQLNTGNIYEKNTIIISNNEVNGHDDGIQVYQDADVTTRSNYIEQRNTKTYNAQGIWMAGSNGTLRVYNNVVYAPNTNNALIGVQNNPEGYMAGNATLVAYNNTVVGGRWGNIYIQNSPNSIAENNIIVSNKSNARAIRISGTKPPTGNIDYNIYYTPNSTQPVWHEGVAYYTWSQWKKLGYEARGINQNPMLKNIAGLDFSLQDTSPAIDAGVTITGMSDFKGTSRPQGSAYDMGAYEFIFK